MTERIVLAGIDAIALWKEGKDAWNQWVEENPDADVSFVGAIFSSHTGPNNLVSFSGFIFPNGIMDFMDAQFGDGYVGFKGSSWKGDCNFHPSVAKHCRALDFSSISIDGELSFEDLTTSCAIDLRHSKLSRPIDLDRVDINLQLETNRWKKWPFYRAEKQEASTCFRRLKKLAKEADDHQSALDFYAKEMRSSYGHTLHGWKLALFLVYDKVSDYGRSLLHPFLYLVLCTEVFGIIYWWKGTEATRSIYDGLTFSLGHAVPLYAGSREARTGNANALFEVRPV